MNKKKLSKTAKAQATTTTANTQHNKNDGNMQCCVFQFLFVRS